MTDRGIIKWLPFNSVINNKSVINSLIKEKTKIKKPIISEEEINTLEEKIIEAYYTQNLLDITYYKNGYLLKTKGKIKKIDQVYKLIYLDNNLSLLFNQIIEIKLG